MRPIECLECHFELVQDDEGLVNAYLLISDFGTMYFCTESCRSKFAKERVYQ